MSSLQQYFRTHPKSLRIFTEVVSNRSTIVSLRLLDWLVTNYVTAQYIPGETLEERTERTNLYFTYTRNLNSYTKVWFDPFARKSADKGSLKIRFHTQSCEFHVESGSNLDDNFVSTTAGQLNFFRVAVEEGFVNYAFEHHDRIQAHMVEGLASRKRTKRESVSESFYKPCSEFQAEPLDALTAFAADPSIRLTVVHPPPPRTGP
jgi:hypothetical protein